MRQPVSQRTSLALPQLDAGQPRWLGVPTSASLVFVHAGTTTSIPLAIPANPLLSDLTAGTQAVSLDPAVAAGFALSNGAILQLR